MKHNEQSGYMDMQLMPVLIGVILMLLLVGTITRPDFDAEQKLLRMGVFLFFATAALLYGFAMHIDSLGYPESPFNKHTSPLLMTPLCAGPLAYAAFRFFRADMLPGAVLYTLLALLVVAAAIGFAARRNKPEPPAA